MCVRACVCVCVCDGRGGGVLVCVCVWRAGDGGGICFCLFVSAHYQILTDFLLIRKVCPQLQIIDKNVSSMLI